ncbi:MAG: hypothetical protein IAE82_15055 [Opitutaceae bacterium]|nr:hypothetical protein [Opitutaceae bacterium]
MKSLRHIATLGAILALFTSSRLALGAPDRAEPSPFGIDWGYLYGHLGTTTRPYLPAVRDYGAGFSRVILFWHQLEPQKGRFDWSVLDTYVNELRSPDEGFITLYAASMWATQVPAMLMPAAPAKDPEDYYRFVYETVRRHRGRVRYWGNDAEPTNPAFWSGGKEKFVEQLRIFHRAVKAADPEALVVLGGCDGIFVPPGMKTPAGDPIPPIPHQDAALGFFEHVMAEAPDAFDVFDLRLYLDPELIAPRVEYIRERMRAHGCEKPILGGEYGGPSFFEFPENYKYLDLVTRWAVKPDDHGNAVVDPSIGQDIARLYDTMATLAPQTQMFMRGCPPELEAKYRRIQSRTLVMQNVFALAAGVRRSLYWQYSPATNERDDIMGLMFAKFSLVENGDGTWKPTITAAAYRRMVSVLDGVTSVRRTPVPEHPSIVLFEVDRGSRGLALVVWERRDRFSGEDAPAVTFTLPTTWDKAEALDALGETPMVTITAGTLTVPVGITPVYLTEVPR